MGCLARALIVLAALPAVAHADGSTEQALSVGFGWATFSTTGAPARAGMAPPTLSPDVGGALAVTYERAVGSDLSLRAEGLGGLFYGGNQTTSKLAQSATSYAALADAGLAFRFDVLKFVPYAFAGIGGVLADGGPIDRDVSFVVVVGGGVDWLTSRERSLGLEIRLASFGGDITVFTIGLRGTTRWGFF